MCGCREIGDDVYFGPGCKVIRPERIGSRARTGANTVVTEDGRDDCTVASVPARVVRRRRHDEPMSNQQVTA